ncbi:MAG: 4-hydroxythreonine-4-phosphate dehydrogenase PdxA [Hyphomicrobiales bacterium]
MSHSLNKPVLLTIGEPAGIGPELAVKLWAEQKTQSVPPFVLMTDPAFIESRARLLGTDITIQQWDENWSASTLKQAFSETLLFHPLQHSIEDAPNQLRAQNSSAVIEAIETAVGLIQQGRASAVVTNPINKNALYEAGFKHPGHTEFLGELAKLWGNTYRPVMMLAGPELRTVPATLHIPLKDVPSALNTQELTELMMITARELKNRFAIASPRIAVTGLNPHAGEEGTMGSEDRDIILPAIKAAQEAGITVSGPHPADTLFYAQKRKTYDAVIAMYHDQALLPVKTIAFDETVNVTLGLPFIRTSPDHGTALDIAGKGIARPDSLLAALKMASEMAEHAAESKIS